MKLEAYIKFCLKKYGCFKLPGLGEFSSERKSGAIKGDKVYPPKIVLNFNAIEKGNDGILAALIAENESIPIREVINNLNDLAKKVLDHLEKNKTYELEKLGYFTKDVKNNLDFIFSKTTLASINLGLPLIQLKPVKKSKSAIKNAPPKGASTVFKWLFIFSSLLIAFLFLFFFNTVLFNGKSETVYKASTSPTISKNQDEYYIIVAGAFNEESNALKKIIELKKQGKSPTLIRNYPNSLFVVSLNKTLIEDKENALKQLTLFKKQEPEAWLYKTTKKNSL